MSPFLTMEATFRIVSDPAPAPGNTGLAPALPTPRASATGARAHWGAHGCITESERLGAGAHSPVGAGKRS
ncbi:hypothetical protein GCM10010230_46930 [Streptomyces narbonensis]|nr:hypothetical protein GCM10010230_46930 [Streptomyces narbonensis]